MIPARLPDDETERLAKLRRYRILDTPPEAAFDRITRIVAKTIGVEIALVSLVDEARQWFKSRYGVDAEETPRDWAFCAHAILGDETFVVEDASKDARFKDNPLVTDAPSIRFYAGAPLTTHDGFKLGTLCAIDSKPQSLSDDHQQLLEDLAHLVIDEMELRIALAGALNQAAEEQRLRTAHDDFLNTVSHELRTPLTSINGTLGLIDGGIAGELPEDVRNLITIASRNTKTLLTLINDLLDIQKLDSGAISFDFGVVDPKLLVTETAENMQSYAEGSTVEIHCEAGGAVPAIVGDHDRLRQALTNIVSNAVKFSPEGGTVTMNVTKAGNRVRIEVHDDGPGIPKTFQSRLFDRFSQAAPRTPDEAKIKGSGLGLAITKAIVEAHQGQITFETGPKKGTTFQIALPIRQSLSR